ncbi:MAG: 2-oxo acid dehydrogenase subunit E2 [Akkermansia sp.]|nr:2-oxo acid dehydrogenase subunit E2 [Akkermansia sp.]MBR2314900.1 2-oxo acid dehydrogenase subunit E2 [Akkermansia sp.]
MPKVPILMPQLGESIAEATIMQLLVKPGDTVQADQEVFEVETNKAVMGVTTVCGGTILSLDVSAGETVPVGAIMGIIDATEEEIERSGATPLAEGAAQPSPAAPATEKSPDQDGAHFRTEGEFREGMPGGGRRRPQGEGGRGLPVPMGKRGTRFLSPRIRARMDQLGITEADMAYVIGTGPNGRITIDDFEQFINYVDGWPSHQASPMRRSVASSMQRTWRRPIASCGRPIFMAPIILHRRNHPRKPGITLYFLRALALALAEAPECAGYMVGGRILTPRRIDLGVAVQVADGVMVPVMRNVNEYTLDELVDEYNKVVKQARDRRLDSAYQGGGIATVSNFGGFGLTTATPMPLPSESLILGVGAVQKVPVWSDEVECFLPVEQAQIVASFDHRVVDGGDIGRLMLRIAHYLEHPEFL